MADVDLNFIGIALERLTTEVRSLRDDMRVLTAMVLRLNNQMTDLTTELHAMHLQISGMNERIRKLEDAQP